MNSLSSLNLLSNPVVVFESQSLKIVFANKAFQGLFDGSPELINKPLDEVVIDEHDSFRVFLSSLVTHVIDDSRKDSGKDDVSIREIPCTFSLESMKRWYEFTVSKTNLPDQRDGSEKGEILIAELRDVSEARNRVEEQTALRANEATTRLKKSFLAMISHELRTPLNTILGMSQLLLDGKIDETQRHYLGEVTNSGRQLLSIVNDLLLYLQLEQGKVVLEPRSFSAFKCIDDVVDVIYEEAERKGIKVVSHYDLSLSDMVFGDPLRIGQVLLNLATNAIKFTASGHIELLVNRVESNSPTEDKVKFTVRDTGVGIPREKLQFLSTPFTQIDDPFTRSNSGTGLGLSICQGFLKLMNARLEIISEMGKGSEFSFTLTLPKVESTHEAIPKLMGKGIVVIVSANDPFAQSLVNTFSSLGYNCLPFSTQEEAILFIKHKKKIFLVLVDFESIQGDDLINEVNRDENLVVDVLSGIGTKAQKRRLYQMREGNLLDGSLLKPLNFNQLQKFLNHLSEVELNPDQQTNLYDVSVLVITKDPVEANVKKNILKSFGKDVDSCNSVSEALDLIGKKFYHLAFISLNLGDESGFQCAQKIRQTSENRNPQILLIGVGNSNSHLLSCVKAGMDDFVLSPTSRESLLEKLKKFFPKSDFGTFTRRSRGSSGHSNPGSLNEKPRPRPESPKHRKQHQASRNSILPQSGTDSPESGHSRADTPVECEHPEILPPPLQPDFGTFILESSPIALKPGKVEEAPPSVEFVPVTIDPPLISTPTPPSPVPATPSASSSLPRLDSGKSMTIPEPKESLTATNAASTGSLQASSSIAAAASAGTTTKTNPLRSSTPVTTPSPPPPSSMLSSPMFSWWQLLVILVVGLVVSLVFEHNPLNLL